MTMGGRKRTSWKPGQSGNPKGRPPGIVETKPRGLMRQLFDDALDANTRQRTVQTLQDVLTDRRRVIDALTLGARLTREIGLGSDEGSARVTIIFKSPLRPEKLR